MGDVLVASSQPRRRMADYSRPGWRPELEALLTTTAAANLARAYEIERGG